MTKTGNIYRVNRGEFYKDLGKEAERLSPRNYDSIKRSALSYLGDITRFDRDDFCYDEWLINFKNGYYSAIDNKFYPSGDFEDKIFCYEIPHKYKTGNYSCPKFIKILNEWLEGNSNITTNDIFETL